MLRRTPCDGMLRVLAPNSLCVIGSATDRSRRDFKKVSQDSAPHAAAEDVLRWRAANCLGLLTRGQKLNLRYARPLASYPGSLRAVDSVYPSIAADSIKNLADERKV